MAPRKDGPRRLKRWREARDISIRGAAKALGVSHVAYRSWEEERAAPHVEMRRAIAIWTHGEVAEDCWPISDAEKHILDAAARVVPHEPKATVDDTGTHSIVNADKAG